jgi:hypothetical protein
VAVSTKLRWKRYINELRFVNEEIDFVREISREAAAEFQAYYEEYCVKRGIDLADLNKQHSSHLEKLYEGEADDEAKQHPGLDADTDSATVVHDDSDDKEEEYSQQLGDYQMSQDEKEIHEAFNKVFRKLAMILHPDKLEKTLTAEERANKLKMFKEAKTALEERKYFVILDIAEKLSITVPKNYKQQIRWMKKETKNLNEALDKETGTYNYLFSECETGDERDQVIRRFLTQLFGPQVFNK